jgi:hypothetical protein
MSGVYTNIARKRIEQSHEASHALQKATDPQSVVMCSGAKTSGTKLKNIDNSDLR